jgi:hypothetical protein
VRTSSSTERDPNKETLQGHIVLWTLPRSYRTFKVGVAVCKAGYGQQAAMLNRTLFEDMLAAHWAMKHPQIAADRMIEHDQYTAVLRAEQYDKHGIPHRDVSLPKYTEAQRRRLDVRYRNGSRPWTGKSIPQMLRAVAPMWPEGDRRLLLQMHDIAHAANSTLLHHSATSLSQGDRAGGGRPWSRRSAQEGPVTLTTAPVTVALPEGEVQETMMVLFGPATAGAVFVSVQLMDASLDRTLIV